MKKLTTTFAAAILATSTIGLGGAAPEHHARFSADLIALQARPSHPRTPGIVHGDAATIDAIAERRHLRIVKRLAAGAVVAASGDEIARLSADAVIDHL